MRYIVVDLEMNNAGKKNRRQGYAPSEVIEIGAVLLDENFTEISAFRTYVKPQLCSRILPNITSLTGITDTMVKNAPPFKEAFQMFTDWCLGTGTDFAIYSWSPSDYLQIAKEMQLKNYEPEERERIITDVPWQDFQKVFDEHLGFERQISLSTALDMAGLEFEGRAHDALYDARNTAALFSAFHDPDMFEKTLQKIKDVMMPSPLENSLGNMFDFSKIVLEG